MDGEELLGRLVDPVEVLEDDDLGADARRPAAISRPSASKISAAALPGIHAATPRRRPDRPRAGTGGTGRSAAGPRRGAGRRVDLLGDRAVSDRASSIREAALEEIDQRVEGDGASEGHAVALEPGRAGRPSRRRNS